jgi:hypothetical protein
MKAMIRNRRESTLKVRSGLKVGKIGSNHCSILGCAGALPNGSGTSLRVRSGISAGKISANHRRPARAQFDEHEEDSRLVVRGS